MAGLVIGIFPGSDPSAIQSALTGQQIDLNNVKVVLRGDASPTEIPDDTALDFIDVGEAMENNSLSDDMTKDRGIMSDSGGTSVPGIGGRGPSLGSFSHSSRTTYLSGFSIPGDEVDNFNGAIEQGRAVILAVDPSDPAATKAAFKAAGLRNVRTY